MHGFVNHTLSYFNVSDFQAGTAPNDPMDLGYEVQICRYGFIVAPLKREEENEPHAMGMLAWHGVGNIMPSLPLGSQMMEAELLIVSVTISILRL